MTTVDQPADPRAGFGALVADVEHRAAAVDVRRVLLAVLIAVPLALGWAAGTLVRGLVYMWAAAAEGYAAGRVRPAHPVPGGRGPQVRA